MKSANDYTIKQALPTLNYPRIRDLLSAILSLKNINETASFFHDLLTPQELKSISNRWMAARYLSNGNSYIKIAEKIKISTTTVTSVARGLNHGSGGLKLILDLIHKNDSRA